MDRRPAEEQFANFALNSHFASLPEQARQSAATFLLDTIGVGIAGSATPEAQQVAQATKLWGAGDAGHALGSGHALPTASAAYLNSFQIHCQEFDCLHEPATVHAMAVVGGALLAVGEARNFTRDQLLLGVAVGVDIAATLGLAASGPLRFFRPATAGALGAAAALARLVELDEHGFYDLWGLTYSQLCGTMQAHVEGSIALPLQIASASRAAVNGLELVLSGLTGPKNVLEGPFGYFELFEKGGNLERTLSELGTVWRVTELSHKPYPTGRAAHGTLDALQQLQQQHGLSLNAVSKITAHVPPLVHRLVARPSKVAMSRSYARLCLPYLSPLLLRDGTIDASSFSAKNLKDAELLRAGTRVHVVLDDNDDPNAMRPQHIEVETAEGATLDCAIEHTLGSPERPLRRERYLEKFRACLAAAELPVERVEQLTSLLDSSADYETGELIALSVR